MFIAQKPFDGRDVPQSIHHIVAFLFLVPKEHLLNTVAFPLESLFPLIVGAFQRSVAHFFLDFIR